MLLEPTSSGVIPARSNPGSSCAVPNRAAHQTKRKRKPKANQPKIDLAGYLQRICGVDLTQVVGLDVLSVLLIVSEIGVDMSKWRNAKAFCSWLGLCPGNKISAVRCSTVAPAR